MSPLHSLVKTAAFGGLIRSQTTYMHPLQSALAQIRTVMGPHGPGDPDTAPKRTPRHHAAGTPLRPSETVPAARAAARSPNPPPCRLAMSQDRHESAGARRRARATSTLTVRTQGNRRKQTRSCRAKARRSAAQRIRNRSPSRSRMPSLRWPAPIVEEGVRATCADT